MSILDSKEKVLYRKLQEEVSSFEDEEEYKLILSSLKKGENKYMRLERVESSSFDLSWIEAIEGTLFDLGDIINAPIQSTKEVSDVIPVELVKKTNAETVAHLASHSQYVRDIDKRGNVIPSKLLNISYDDELHTYENRFIATLIRRLVLFVEKRYEFVKNFAVLHDEEELYLKNKSTIHGHKVEIETKVKVTSLKDDDSSLESNSYIQRIANMRKVVLYYYHSSFMKEMKSDSDVRNPILMTNIIRKNPKYHKCYLLYRFIETYDKLGVDYKIHENYSDLSEEEREMLSTTLLYDYLSLMGKDKSEEQVEKEETFSPVVLTSSDDLEFLYGPLLKGPIVFARVDSDYGNFLKNQVVPDLPVNPTKEQKDYYLNELSYQEMSQKEEEELKKLYERKKEEEITFEEEAKKKVKELEKKAAELQKAIVKERLDFERDYLRTFREKIADDAYAFHTTFFLHKELTDGLQTSYEPELPQIEKIDEEKTKIVVSDKKEEPVDERHVYSPLSLVQVLTDRLLSSSPHYVYFTLGDKTELGESRSFISNTLSPTDYLTRSTLLLTDLTETDTQYVVLTLDGFIKGSNQYTLNIKEAKVYTEKKDAAKVAQLLHGRVIEHNENE